MIKIRYRDPNELSPGLHAAVERHGRTTTVYLRAGLNGAERRAALRRIRMAARRGYGPRLPAPQMALAHLGDRVRTALVQTGSVLRLHPAGSTVPVILLSAGAVAFLAVSAVSMRVGQHGESGESLPIISAISAHGPSASPGSIRPGGHDGSPDRQGSGGGSYQQGYAGGGTSGGYDVPSGSPSPTPGASRPARSPTSSRSPSPSPSPSPARPTPLPSPSTVQPAPTPTSDSGVVCVTEGGTQVCL